MSTRSVIAKPTPTGWKGVYCHWDGYPTCRASEIWVTYQELGSASAVRKYALRGEWSSFMPPSEATIDDMMPDTVPCDLCDGTGDRTARDLREGLGPFQPNHCNGCGSTGTTSNRDKKGTPKPGDKKYWITSDGPDCGTEWAYVIEDDALVIFERRFGTPDDDQGHGVGMFGLGASDTDEGGYWQLVGSYPWTDQEPDWESVQRTTPTA